jgi:hypothetical protein
MWGFGIDGFKFSNLENMDDTTSNEHLGVNPKSNGYSKKSLPSMHSAFPENSSTRKRRYTGHRC